ncbi:protein POLLENLESS 3 [Sesamum angolense]|uniref:Protein POLLENLESS 3 n=1 Tax=Sesamum angolense TaxID=2727404 RepID=A0AAE1WTP8_9LAMI|nr:protein POLLENLESS 3 [Sesamum angolense]
MSSRTGVDYHNNDYSTQSRGFLTPPPTWKTRRCPPVMPASEKKPRRSPQSRADLFHIIHKVPSGDSPYVRAKHVQLIDKDPSRAISLFWSAINAGDRVDSALKDMAVVMKQLDRSDEAIEAIKSFRYLCPPESQESLDNILVELYKQSGRIEEEIEMLQLKLKQVEEGIAFGGKRTKMARSQGKKIHITVEKEYSRLLGNLAWAYMQQKDFKSAEENYRKALSFESDKNKQCNLAVCLMHMNKLTEAKFLLQAIRDSCDNGHIDESHVKSYERASQMLVELESQHVLKPMKQTEHCNDSGMARWSDGHLNRMEPFGGQWDSGFHFRKNCDDKNGMQSSPLPLSVDKMKNEAFTELPCEKRADSDWRTNHYQPNMGHGMYSACKRAYTSPFCNQMIPKVPFTQPRRCLRSGDQRKGWLKENAYANSCRKLSFGSFTDTENVQSLVNKSVNYYSTASPAEMRQISEKHFPVTGGDWRKNSSDNLDGNSGFLKPLETDGERMNTLAYDCKKSATEESDLPLNFSVEYAETKEICDRISGQCCRLTSGIWPSNCKDEENLQTGRITCEDKKSWADMVEEDEQGLVSWRNDFPRSYSDNQSQESLLSIQTPADIAVGSMIQEGFNDENVDSNIISETPKSLRQAEKLSEQIELIDLGRGYFTQPEKTTLSTNQAVRRSLYFDQNHKPGTAKDHCTSPLTVKVFNFEGQSLELPEDVCSTKSVKRRNRLKVFQDITLIPESSDLDITQKN